MFVYLQCTVVFLNRHISEMSQVQRMVHPPNAQNMFDIRILRDNYQQIVTEMQTNRVTCQRHLCNYSVS